ncbi:MULTISPECIES: translation elongation factor Ts [Corallincola]|uniref:Elongation factor Ts n=3 Tax=Corallincola TaxID=1775176 RepID=A0A368NDZ5_9GAMM|nr:MULTISPECIES: translation elongation factor Ts [Corallincola]RCU48867.1 elongation factor Ts [Corallincola holothuriorum]TAA43761.1 elongation factor Ts [Corallincola spongiicola]TCI03008.1 elongation factor Ts [Corallincola luteus]
MAAVTAALVKELRERTGAGMMDCKKALVAADGDIEKAIEEMRKSGQAKAAKKAGRVAAEGIILAKSAGDKAVMIELNSETDFVARDENFLAFGEKLISLALDNKTASLEALLACEMDGVALDTARTNLITKIGENINIRRVALLEGADVVASYIHGARIGVLVAANGADEALAKDIAMHVAASNPQFLKPEDVSADVVEKEKQIQIEIAMNSGKPAEIAEKMVMGRMKKFTGEISLTGQPFVKDPSTSVGGLLKSANADVTNFVRFEVGEGIEKAEDDFAAEVQAQVAAAQKA